MVIIVMWFPRFHDEIFQKDHLNYFEVWVRMAGRSIEGDWEYNSNKVETGDWAPTLLWLMIIIQGYDPVKISIKNFQNTQWLVACMIPKGNMMASTLNKLDDDNYELIEFRCSNKKETPEENKRLEEEFKLFLEKGISKISRQGSIHYIHSAFITLLG